MIRPTDQELRQIRDVEALVTAHRQKRNRLRALLAAYQAHETASSEQLYDRINFVADPNRVAGMCEVYHRQHKHFHQAIDRAYDFLLFRIKEAINPGEFPLRINYHALKPEARPYLLGPFLNLTAGRVYQRLCLKRSDPQNGRLTYLATGGALDRQAWQSRLLDIASWLGERWVIADHTASTITLTRQKPLPSVIPFDASMQKHGSLFLGIDTHIQKPTHLPFSEMTSGTFIPGASGTGKSNALHILLQSIFANLDLFAAVFLVDGKDGVAFNRYQNVAPGKVHVLWDEPDLWSLTSKLVKVMRHRNAAQRQANIDKTTRHFIAVVIDEMSTYTARPSSDTKHPDNKRHTQFIDDLAMLAKRGRSTGFRLIITAQEPVNADIPANVRANCLTTVSFKLPIDAHAIAVFNQIDGLPSDPRKLPQGQALIKHGLTGTLQTVQFPLIPPPTASRGLR